jgi:hypothetical protein
MQMSYFFVLLLSFISCTQEQQSQHTATTEIPEIKPVRKVGEIPIPKGYKRIKAAANSFTFYSRNIPLKDSKTVYLYNGIKKGNQSAQYAVLNIDVGNKDLQQCADAVMRLRAEYLFSIQDYKGISFLFTNGFYCDFRQYAEGKRVRFNGNDCYWSGQSAKDYSHQSLRTYLDLVYAYAGTKSLFVQMKSIPFSSIVPGTVFLQKREPYGHAITVMDMAYNAKTKDTIFLLSQSYMPAQDIHILVNPIDSKLSPWYSIRFNGDLNTPEWNFTKADLKAF